MLSLSLMSPSLAHEKAIEQRLTSLEALITSQRLPAAYVRMLPAFLFGQLKVKMSSVWGRVQRCLAVLMQGYGEQVADAYLEEMSRSGEEVKALVTDEERHAMQGHEEQTEPSVENAAGDDDVLIPADSVTDPTEAHVEGAPVDDAQEAAADEAEVEEEEAVEEDEEEEEDVVQGDAGVPALTLSSAFALFTHSVTRSTDVYAYHGLLQRTLSLDEARAFADRHSAQLSALFLLFYSTQYQLVYPAQDPPPPIPLLPSPSASSSVHPIPSARKTAKVRLLQFLRLFDSSFTLQHLGVYRAFFPAFLFRLLVHGDGEVQGLALKGLGKWGWQWLKPYQARLLRLIGEGTWREEMTAWPLDPEVSTVDAQHRRPLSAVVIRLLYPKLTQSGGKAQRGKSTVAQRRAAILAYLAGLHHEELEALIAIMTSPFVRTLRIAAGLTPVEESSATTVCKGKQEARESDEAVILRECSPTLPPVDLRHIAEAIDRGLVDAHEADVDLGKQVGFVRLLDALLSQMRSVLRGYLPHLLVILLAALKRANERIDDFRNRAAAKPEEDVGTDDAIADEQADDDSADTDGKDEKRVQKELRGLRQLVFSRMATIVDVYHAHFCPSDASAAPDLTPFLSRFLDLAAPSISLLAAEHTQHKGGLLSVLLAMSVHPTLVPTLARSPNLLPSVFSLLSAVNASPEVIKAVLSLCEHLLSIQQDAVAILEEERTALDRAGTPRRALSSSRHSIDRVMMDSSDEEADEDTPTSTPADDAATQRSREQTKALAALVEAAWRQHIGAFLHHMHAYLSSTFSAAYYPRRELSIIARVSLYASEPDSARRLIALLLPFLSHLSKVKGKEWRHERVEDARMRSKQSVQHSLLTILHATVGLHPEPASLVSFLARQFLVVSGHANRALLASVFGMLGERAPELRVVAPLLREMSAISGGRVDEADYDRIVNAYTEYHALLPSLTVEQQTPLLYLMLHHVGWDELAVRGQACQTLKDFVDVRGVHVEAAVTAIIFPAIKRGPPRTPRRGGGKGGG